MDSSPIAHNACNKITPAAFPSYLTTRLALLAHCQNTKVERAKIEWMWKNSTTKTMW